MTSIAPCSGGVSSFILHHCALDLFYSSKLVPNDGDLLFHNLPSLLLDFCCSSVLKCLMVMIFLFITRHYAQLLLLTNESTVNALQRSIGQSSHRTMGSDTQCIFRYSRITISFWVLSSNYCICSDVCGCASPFVCSYCQWYSCQCSHDCRSTPFLNVMYLNICDVVKTRLSAHWFVTSS
jgi:hypothetical protein